MSARPHPPALPHGEIRELFEDIYFVTGTVRMPAPVPVTFSRNMTVLRAGGALTLVNSMRLDDAGLAALERLGKVEHVIRLAAFHGLDDAFYRERYSAKVWAVRGSFYAPGFELDPSKAYFEPDEWMDDTTRLPIDDARLIRIASAKPSEGLLLLERHGGILVSGDCLQNWARPDAYFSFVGRLMMRVMGFIKPYNIGPGWLKAAKPDSKEVKRLLELDFEHVLPAHGIEVIGEAKQKFRPALERLG